MPCKKEVLSGYWFPRFMVQNVAMESYRSKLSLHSAHRSFGHFPTSTIPAAAVAAIPFEASIHVREAIEAARVPVPVIVLWIATLLGYRARVVTTAAVLTS